ncbi:hypothetical protein Esti_004408 [Eimeria stiedai]
MAMAPAQPPSTSGQPGLEQCSSSRRPLWLVLKVFVVVVLNANCRPAKSAADATSVAVAVAAAAILSPLPGSSKKVYGIARGGKFAAVGDFCYSIPKGSSGSLVAEAVLKEQGHELLIHSKSATEEYKKATQEAGVSPGAAGEAAALATCKALQTNARIRESLSPSLMIPDSSEPLAFVTPRTMHVVLGLSLQSFCVQIIRCEEGQQLDVVYSLTFLNSGGFFSRQFSCQDQGLLQLFAILALFAAAICCHTLAVYKQQPRHELSPLAAAATCCCCLLGGGIVVHALHLLAYAADGQGLPMLKFLGHVLLLSSRCGGLLLFLVMSAKGVEGGAVDSKTSGVISVVTLSIAAATLSALLGASLSPNELNPSALYTSRELLWFLPENILQDVSLICAVLLVVMSLLNADSASRLPERRLFVRLCCWGTGYMLCPLFVICFLNGYPLVQAYALLNAEIACICAMQRMACRGSQLKSTQMAQICDGFLVLAQQQCEDELFNMEKAARCQQGK